MNQTKTASANVIFSDYPDLDVIRVENTYYMVSTTMHFMPGCVILRSYNLVDWEICSYVYDELEATPAQLLDGEKSIYGNGMWAASLKFHDGKFYVCFTSNDLHKSFIYVSDSINGPWKKQELPDFFHDLSLFFDDDGRVFIISGNTNIRLVELENDFSSIKKGGIDKIIVKDESDFILGYEGSHFYKINGKYYVFFIHWPKGQYRTQACFCSDKIEGPYTGSDVLNSDFMNWNSGVAQGGIVDDGQGNWFSMLFQDHGAMGRMPVLVPMKWKNGWPVLGTDGKVPEKITVIDYNPAYIYESLYCNDFTDQNGHLKNPWQWNHIPDLKLVSFPDSKTFSVITDKTCRNIMFAKNTLTQRTFTHHCEASVTLDFSGLNNGDFAGLCAFEGNYGFAGVTKKGGRTYIVAAERNSPVEKYKIGSTDKENVKILWERELDGNSVRLKAEFDFSRENENVCFYFSQGSDVFEKAGYPKKLEYSLDHFTGCRAALFIYSTENAGGKASFTDFEYKNL